MRSADMKPWLWPCLNEKRPWRSQHHQEVSDYFENCFSYFGTYHDVSCVYMHVHMYIHGTGMGVPQHKRKGQKTATFTLWVWLYVGPGGSISGPRAWTVCAFTH